MRPSAADDRLAVVELIERETAAFWNKDFDAWQDCWIHSPHVRRWGWWAARGGLTVRDGWDQQEGRMRALMQANPEPNASVNAVKREKLQIRISGDMAWTTFDQVAPSTGDGMDVAGRTHELRILERDDDGWKLACIFFLQRSLDHLRGAVFRVDRRRQIGWMNDAAREVLVDGKVLEERGGFLCATDRAADRHLRSTIEWASHLDDELYARRGAVPVILDGDETSPATVCWVLGENGDVLVSVNDHELVVERVTAAAATYGLTPAQTRLARLIVEGQDVVHAAVQLGIGVTTARTHLRRIYDRVGVRNQAALARVLLTVARPFDR